MKFLRHIAKEYSLKSRMQRAEFFRKNFKLVESTKILDLGSESGDNIHFVLLGTPVKSENVYIADIQYKLVEEGSKKYGYMGVKIPESGRLPFADKFFDLVYCSSVIEHVTVPKSRVWTIFSGRRFKKLSFHRQVEFAREVQRLGRNYYVQTPNKYFPIESHSWLPIISYLPRFLLLLILRFTNVFWIKATAPDWNLLTKKDLSALFMDASVHEEKSMGMTKSLMAVRIDDKREA